MAKFVVNPIKVPKTLVKGKNYDYIPEPLPKPPITCSILAPTRSGKTNLAVNLLVNGHYAKAFSEVLVLSETAAHDKLWYAVKKMPNVTFHDIRKRPIDNELLQDIWDRQEARALKDPNDDLLIILDDLGAKLKSAEMRKQLTKYMQLCRHPKISIIVICQSLLNITGEMITNSKQFIIFQLDQRALNKVSDTLATALKDRKELEAWIKRNTQKRYSWVLINKEAEHDEYVYQAYDPDTKTFSPGL